METRIDIPPLAADDVECRVQSVSKSRSGKVGAILLLYKNARVDMRVLDKVFGQSNWKRSHEVIGGNLYCNIDVWDEDKREWVRKQDVGTESNTEKEKGQASDAFKRAGFNWGIGRELYTAPFVYVELNDKEYYSEKQGAKDIYRCYSTTKFEVSHIAYNDKREISELTIVDKLGNVRYIMNAKANDALRPTGQQAQRPSAAKPAQTPNPAPPRQKGAQINGIICTRCGAGITEAERIYSLKNYERELCRACQNVVRSETR